MNQVEARRESAISSQSYPVKILVRAGKVLNPPEIVYAGPPKRTKAELRDDSFYDFDPDFDPEDDDAPYSDGTVYYCESCGVPLTLEEVYCLEPEEPDHCFECRCSEDDEDDESGTCICGHHWNEHSALKGNNERCIICRCDGFEKRESCE